MKPRPQPPRIRLALIVLLALGLLARGVAVGLAPTRSYIPDHLDNMAWSDYAYTHGLHRIYGFPERTPYLVRYRADDGTLADALMLVPHACNYPPGAAYVFWVQGALWHAVDSDVRTVDAPRGLPVAQVTSRTLDTLTARAVQAIPACLFDIPLALGVAAIVGWLRAAPRWGIAEAAAFGAAFLAPPLFINSAFWGQADSWIACWMVWCLYALVRRRLLLAGVLFGIALMTKPQAILLAPVLAFWLLSLRYGEGGSWPRLASAWKFVVPAGLTVAALAAPFMLADRDHPDGPLRWFERSYAATIGAETYNRTTLNAFNIWWLDWMTGEPTIDRLDADIRVAGFSKKQIGLALLAAVVLVSAVLVAARRRFSDDALVTFAALTLLAAFLFPTSVHERYIYYCLPFFIVLAAVQPWSWAWPLAALLVVATGEMTAFLWVKPADSSAARVVSTAMAVASLAAFAASWLLVALRRRPGRAVPPL